MPFLHVLISNTEKPEDFRCILHDLTEAELNVKVLRPYKSGKSILAERRIYPASELRGLKIVRTEKPAEVALEAASEEVNKSIETLNSDSKSGVVFGPFLGYGLDNLAEAGSDVTLRYVKGAPGDGGVAKAANILISHPWVSGIGTAVLATAIAAWLKLA
jgi:hypothetical protein